MNILLPIIPGTLPEGVCYPNEQARINDYASHLNALVSGGGTGMVTAINIGDTTPDPSRNGFPWLKNGRIYTFSGDWISPAGYSLFERRLFKGTLLQLQTYDGGDVNPPSDRSGSMWIEDTTCRGRSPMGPGAIPDASPAKNLALAEQFGAGSVALTSGQLPAHHHALNVLGGWAADGNTDARNEGLFGVRDGQAQEIPATTADTGTGDAVGVIPPVIGIYIVKWSGRLYFKA